MIKTLNQLKEKAIEEIEKTLDNGSLEKLAKKYLGRKGSLRKVLEDFKDIKEEIEKKNIGALVNEVKKELEGLIESKKIVIKEKAEPSFFDPTIQGKKQELGHLHPLTQFLRKVLSVFISMGFEIYEGPEIETEEHNFDLLNIPKDHPARDVWDTFYLEGGLLLRTHTSPGQLRVMEERKPPVRIVIPGKCYRHEATDAKHEVNFYQVEGLVIEERVSLTDLIGTLDAFIKQIFGDEIKTRARPSFFPFVEPGMEIDMSCVLCGGKGCSTCQHEGWIEVLGAGMVHSRVLQNMKVDTKKYSGFAFGMGIDRLMMLYYGVNDIRLSYSGDLRFIRQF